MGPIPSGLGRLKPVHKDHATSDSTGSNEHNPHKDNPDKASVSPSLKPREVLPTLEPRQMVKRDSLKTNINLEAKGGSDAKVDAKADVKTDVKDSKASDEKKAEEKKSEKKDDEKAELTHLTTSRPKVQRKNKKKKKSSFKPTSGSGV